MISTDITDILFGTPKPIQAEGSFGIFKEDEVNLVVHGHEPLLAEMIYDVVNEPEMIAYAKTKGAKGINLGGMCCTANEILMRHGIPTAGGFTNQELGIMTGLVDLMTVDVQCIMPAITQVSKKFHTKVITTNYRARRCRARSTSSSTSTTPRRSPGGSSRWPSTTTRTAPPRASTSPRSTR